MNSGKQTNSILDNSKDMQSNMIVRKIHFNAWLRNDYLAQEYSTIPAREEVVFSLPRHSCRFSNASLILVQNRFAFVREKKATR